MRWHELVGHVRAHHPIANATDQWIELCWRFPDPKVPLRQQQLLWPTEVNGDPYFVIASEVSMPRRARALAALNYRSSLGHLVEEGDNFQLRLALPARGLTPAMLDRLLQAVAHEAAQLSAPRRRPSGTHEVARVP
jgi:hypothetical protein